MKLHGALKLLYIVALIFRQANCVSHNRLPSKNDCMALAQGDRELKFQKLDSEIVKMQSAGNIGLIGILPDVVPLSRCIREAGGARLT